MVGYHKHDSITQMQKFMAGCVSGVITRFLTQPMDVIKIKTQLQKSQRKVSVTGLISRIFKEEGITAFWQGHNLGQVHAVVSVSSQFYIYEMATKFISNHPAYQKEYKPAAIFACGTTSGAVSSVIVSPLEVIRIRQMLERDQYKGLVRGAKAVYGRRGILGFYEGLSASTLQMGLQSGIAFTVFSYAQSWLLRRFSEKCPDDKCRRALGNVYQPQYILLASTIAGSASGFVSKTLTYPFDLMKRRLQIASHKEAASTPSTSKNLIKCSRIFECFSKTIETEGYKGLFRGWGVTIIKSQVTSMIAFTSYELACYTIRELDSK